jgi:hypothetical protein
MAVCLISLNDFQKALATHQAARTFCEEHGMPALVVQADYNVAYLYYLRGEYSRALEGLRPRVTRRAGWRWLPRRFVLHGSIRKSTWN